jgi:hypothetical protein
MSVQLAFLITLMSGLATGIGALIAFWGKKENMDLFYKETGAELLPTGKVPPLAFLAATKGRQPIIVLMENGEVVDLYNSINIDEQRIVEFLK